jgi:hypothetical protein
MSAKSDEWPVTERVPGSPELKPQQIREVSFRELAIRFIAGALTSVAAGVVTLVFGPRVGGVFLAFPAILAASLTLIEQEEDSANAREDARGAMIGGIAMAAFAGIAAITFLKLNAAVALALATVGWFVVAVGCYFAAWFRSK